MPKIDIVNAKNIIESNPEKAFFKLKNTGGPKGDTGAQGPQGPKGDTGAQGAPGASASVTVGSTTTLSPGADATVTNSGDTRNAILNFGIPTGARGPQGAQGPKGDTGPMGQTGAKGDTGAAATVQVGNTNTGAPGTNAQVTNVGNEHFAVFNFTIPRGDKGATGATGAQGPKGDTGAQGPQGIQGPQGATGSVKSEVVAELPETGEGDTFYLVNREATEQTATGKVISFENSDNAGDITDFQLDGETSQKTYSGKNLLNLNGFVKGRLDNGVLGYASNTTALSVGGDSISFTTNANYRGITTEYIAVEPGGTYSTNIPTTGIYGADVAQYDSAKNFISQGSVNATQTYSGTTHYIRIYLFLRSSGSATLDSLQLELGSATAYEPYVGGTPAPNPEYPQAVHTVTGENLVNICGKNLFNKSAVVTGALMSNGTIDASYTDIRTSDYIPVKGGETYILSGVPGGWGSVGMYDSNKTFISRPYSGNGQYVIPDNAAYARPVIVQGDLGTCQFELGSTATTYESYKIQSYEVNLGKNLLDSSSYEDAYISNTGVKTTGGGLNALFGYISVSPSTSYTISASSSTRFSAAFYNGTSFISRDANHDGTSLTFTTPNNCNRIRCWVYKYEGITQSYIDSLNLQLELGSQATSYAAYFEPIELCKIGDYQDSIYKSGDKWYVRKEVEQTTLDGSETITRNTTSTSGVYRFFVQISGIANAGVRSDKFENTSNTYANDGIGFNTYGGNNGVYIRYASVIGAMTTAEFKTWLGSNNVSVYYALATPTDTEITNQALIEQLDNLASAALYSGTNNIFTITPNEVPTLELDYVTYDKYNQNKVYIWNDTLQQWQIIVQ